MFDEERPDEPDEPYSEPAVEEPGEEIGPDVPEAPTPPNPADSLPDASEVDSDLRKSFWALVLLANAALFGLTVGPMALYFGNPQVGKALVAVGVFGVLAGARRYRQAQRARERD